MAILCMYVHVCVYVHVCNNAQVEAKGWLAFVILSFHHVGPKDRTRLSGWAAIALDYGAILPALFFHILAKI